MRQLQQVAVVQDIQLPLRQQGHALPQQHSLLPTQQQLHRAVLRRAGGVQAFVIPGKGILLLPLPPAVQVKGGSLRHRSQIVGPLIFGDHPHLFQVADHPQHGLLHRLLGPVVLLQDRTRPAQHDRPVAGIQLRRKLPVVVVFYRRDHQGQHRNVPPCSFVFL